MQDPYAHCEAVVRAADKDRFLAALFAPAERRRHLYALYAFNGEIARVRELAREALPGEIRLQWWRDALAGEARGEVSANPVAAALLDTVAKCGLSLEPLIRLIDAHAFDLYDDAMATLADLDAYGRDTDGALMSLAARVLAGDDAAAAAANAGIACAVTRRLRTFPVRRGAAADVRAAGASRSPRRCPCRDRGAPELAGAAGGARRAARPRRGRVRRVSSRRDGDSGALRAGLSRRGRRAGMAGEARPRRRSVRRRRAPAMAAAMDHLARCAAVAAAVNFLISSVVASEKSATFRDRAQSTKRSRMLRRALRMSTTIRRSASDVISGSMSST